LFLCLSLFLRQTISQECYLKDAGYDQSVIFTSEDEVNVIYLENYFKGYNLTFESTYQKNSIHQTLHLMEKELAIDSEGK
jgi:hypothetical protein